MSQFTVGTCFSSLYWLSGFISLTSGLYYGLKRIITHQTFSPRAFIEIVETYQVQAIISASTHVGLLLQYPGLKMANLQSIRALVVTGGICQEHLRKQMQEYLLYGTVLVAYGMTELATSVTSTMPFEKPSLSIGRPLKNIEMKVILAPPNIQFSLKKILIFFQIIDDDGNVLGPNQEGEILIKSGLTFLGYMENPEATKDFIDDEDWIHTGDLGMFDDTLNFYVNDRKKDTLKYFGFESHKFSFTQV